MNLIRIFRDIKIGIKSLLLHKLRSFLTMLGVVFGVGSVVAMLSIGEGASREALAQIRKLGANNVIVNAVKPENEKNANTGRSFMSVYGLLYDDEQRIEESFPSVVTTAPAKILRRDARIGTRVTECRVVGTTPDWFRLVQRPLIAGTTLKPEHMRDSAGVVVLAEALARKLLAGQHSIGQSVRIGTDYFTIVGIIRNETASAGGVQTPDQAIDAYIPLPAAREHFGDINTERRSGSFIRERVELHQIIAQVDQIKNVQSSATAIETMLDRFHEQKDYELAIPLALLRQAEATQRIFNIVLGSIAGISLLVGGIGIMNIMLASVTERTREIGIRRAIGAQRRQIIVQFLIETMVLSLAGGLIGLGLGLGIPELITRFADMPTVVTAWSLILSLGISAFVGIVFGLYPAYRAASLDPIVALRHE